MNNGPLEAIMQNKSQKSREGAAGGGRLLIFTDLDGTLLDHDTYRWDQAVPALERCRSLGVPVVMVSSKTRAEMEPLRKLMGLDRPFISENGGGIFFPRSCPHPLPLEARPAGDLQVWPLGVPHSRLAQCLRAIREKHDWPLKGFSDMKLEEISALTGLDLEGAALAASREFDEPFTAPEDLAPEQLERAASEWGLRVTRGGRFFHLFGKSDKGKAVEQLAAWYKGHPGEPLTMGLGDGANDIPMLLRVDVPVLVGSAATPQEIAEKVPGVRITEAPGPAGWNEAVLEFLDHHLQGR